MLTIQMQQLVASPKTRVIKLLIEIAVCILVIHSISGAASFHLSFRNRLLRSIQQHQSHLQKQTTDDSSLSLVPQPNNVQPAAAQLYHPANPNPQLNPASSMLRPIECRNANNHSEVGICMFSIDCMQNKGVPLSICKHNYFVGTCCRLPNYNNFAGIVYDLRDTETHNLQLEARKALSQAAINALATAGFNATTSATSPIPNRQTTDAPQLDSKPQQTTTSDSNQQNPTQTSDTRQVSVKRHQQAPVESSNGLVASSNDAADKYVISSTSLFGLQAAQGDIASAAVSSTKTVSASPAPNEHRLQQQQQQQTSTTTLAPVESPRNADGGSASAQMLVNRLASWQIDANHNNNNKQQSPPSDLVDSFQIQLAPQPAIGDIHKLSNATNSAYEIVKTSSSSSSYDYSTGANANAAPEVMSSAHSSVVSSASGVDRGQVSSLMVFASDRQHAQLSQNDLVYQMADGSSSSSSNTSNETTVKIGAPIGNANVVQNVSESSANAASLAPKPANEHQILTDGFTLSSHLPSSSIATLASSSLPPTQEFASSTSNITSTSAGGWTQQLAASEPVPLSSQFAKGAANTSIVLQSSELSGPVDLVSSTMHRQADVQSTTPFTSSLSTASLPSVSSKPYSPTASPALVSIISSTWPNEANVSVASLGATAASDNDATSSIKQTGTTTTAMPNEASATSESLITFSQLYSSQHSPTATATATTTTLTATPTPQTGRPPANRPPNGAQLANGLAIGLMHPNMNMNLNLNGLPMMQAASKIVAGPSTNHLIPGLGGLQSAILAHIPFKLANGLSSGLSSYLQAAMKPTGSRPLLSSNTAPASQYQPANGFTNSTSGRPATAATTQVQQQSPSASVSLSGVRFPIQMPATDGPSLVASQPPPTHDARDPIREAQLVCGRPQVSQMAAAPIVANAIDNQQSTAANNKRRVGRIVGGNQSWFGQWPWMVSLRQWRKGAFLHKCGAALLNENWAITAAHCVENVKAPDLLLRLGEFDVSKHDEPYPFVERRVKSVVSHPSFDPKTFEYDLALLRFADAVPFERNILPVCVPNGNDSYVDRMATVIGWGRLYEDGPLPDVIQHVDVPIITNNECEKMYKNAGYVEEIPEMFICAGINKGGRDSCEGDSGGPLTMVDNDGRSYLVGIISWGIGCALPSQPGVYTRITAFSGWINDMMLAN